MQRRTLMKSALAAAAFGSLPLKAAWAEDVPAITLEGDSTTLDKGDIRAFAESFNGVVLRPDSVGYDMARQVWNRFWDRRPALIAHCMNVDDVVSAVKFARAKALLTAVRCGGHSMSGKGVCDGGLVIDLTQMNAVDINVAAQTAHVQGGALLGDLDRKALPLGLATTAGVVSHTGVGGLTLGGGMGRLQRRFGLAIDNVLGVELVTAEGKVLNANATENPDLYWGVRGGGGNFGIVTKFIFRLHQMNPMVINFGFNYPMAKAKDALKLYFDFSNNAHEDLFVLGGVSMREDGSGGVSIGGNYFGPMSEVDKMLKPLRDFDAAVQGRVFPIEYVKIQQVADDGFNAPGNRHYAKGGFLREINDDLITTLVERMEPMASRQFSVGLLPMDGAPAQVGNDETVWAHRDASYNIDSSSKWAVDNTDVDEQNIAWNRAYWNDIEPFTRGFYVNSLIDESQGQVNDNYGGNYDRLVQVKNTYDPSNFFRLNANVRPSA
ncbi:MAG: FAD-dependent oxidoreductase [Rhodospirillaceae bacterium]